MKKKLSGILCLVAGLAFLTSAAYPWGSGVHVYIASQIKPGNPNVWYGAMAPDLFNYAFELGALKDVMYDQLHGYPQLLWNPAGTFAEKSLAYGCLLHREADQTAHYGGVQFGKLEGYIIAKARVLDDILASKFSEFAMIRDAYPEISLSIAHNIVENSIDILLKRMDSQIGLKIMQAASGRDGGFAAMLVAVFGAIHPSLPGVIPAVEGWFNGFLSGYGGLFAAGSQATIIDVLSAQMAAFAPVFLPPGIEMPYETAFNIVRTGTLKGMDICKGTFFKEIKETIQAAQANLAAYVIE